jgi:ATP-dependent protease ClpP protease subunit
MKEAQAKKFYKFTASATGESTLEIFGDIAEWWGHSLESLAWDLYGRTGPLRVLLNSPGGDLLQGVAMGNMLKAYPGTVTVEVIGFCASAATILAAGADKVKMHQGAFYMIHNPATVTSGDAAQLQKDVETLKKMETEMSTVYVNEMKKRDKMQGMTDEAATKKVKEWMSAETWFTPAEAVEYGFADEIVTTAETVTDTEPYNATASPIYAKFKNAPFVAQHTAMSKDKKTSGGFLADMAALVKQYTAGATETPTAEATTTTTEAAPMTTDEMKAALEAQGYTVAHADGGESDTTETAEEPTAEAVTMYTEADLAQAVQRALQTAKAAKPDTKGEAITAPKPGDAAKARFAKALSPLSKALKN